MIGTALLVALVVNLTLYGIGRAAGGDFTYKQSGKQSTVDAASVVIMSLGPLLVGLLVVAWLGPKSARLIRAATIAVPVLALATIAFMTVPAHLDTTSTVFLSCMHIALIPIGLWAIAALRRPVLPQAGM